jgi:cell division protease FtsH
MEKPAKERPWHFDIGYFLFALTAILLFQQLWSTYRETAVVPYSEFSSLLREDKITEVEVGQQAVRATLKEPLPDGRKELLAMRVDPKIAEELEAAKVKYSGARWKTPGFRRCSPGSCRSRFSFSSGAC